MIRFPKRFSRAKRKKLRSNYLFSKQLYALAVPKISEEIIRLTIENPTWLKDCYDPDDTLKDSHLNLVGKIF